MPIDGPELPLVTSGQVDAALNYVEMSPTRLALQEETFQLALAEHGVGGYGLNVIASRAAYDDAPDLIEGLTAAIVEGYRGGCADRPAATRVFLDLFPGQDARYRGSRITPAEGRALSSRAATGERLTASERVQRLPDGATHATAQEAPGFLPEKCFTSVMLKCSSTPPCWPLTYR